MNELTSYAQALLASVTINVIIPLVILVVMLFAMWRLIAWAQRKPDFHIEEIFLDESGKASTSRFLMLFAFAFSCWYLAVGRLSPSQHDPWEFWAFLAAFANSLAIVRLAERWNGQLPFTKSPPTPTEPPQ